MESIPRPVRHLEENTVREKSGVLPSRDGSAVYIEHVGNEDNSLRFPSITGALALWKFNG